MPTPRDIATTSGTSTFGSDPSSIESTRREPSSDGAEIVSATSAGSEIASATSYGEGSTSGAPSAHPGDEFAPFCIHLQSKKSYFRTLPPREESDILDASRHCWCRKTMQILGPDGEIAAPEDCRRSRGCFQGIF